MAKGGGGSGPTIAKAYVAIIPTTRDAQKNISKELIPAMSDAGKSGGEAVSGGLASSLKAGASKIATIAKAAIAGAGVAAVTKFVHDSVGAFSDFEQLSGGVQKIFDEIDPSQILNDAKDAYKTLGMSANQYLGAMTGVGATFASTLGDAKGYEVAKEGLQAISDFASGTGKSVDLLTEKYTLITRSTSSYQSIADQFSGILPATNDAFLEQAQDAGLLSEQYEKLTDVPLAEYQEAVTQMLTRGVDAMGLLGNTSAEAATTLAGSSEAMRGAWQNLLVAFGTGDMPEITSAMDNMGEALLAYMANLVPRIGTILMGVVQVLPGIGQKIIESVPDLVIQFAQAFDSYLAQFGIGSDLTGALSGAMTQISETVSQVMSVIPMDAIMSFISNLTGALPGAMTQISETVSQVMSVIPMDAITSFITTLIGALPGAMTQISETVSQVMSAIPMDAIMSFISNLTAGITSILPTARDVLESIIGHLTNIASAVLPAFVDIGQNIIWPLIQGLSSLITESLLPKIEEYMPAIMAGCEEIWSVLESIATTIGDLISAFADFLEPIIRGLFEFLKPILDFLIDRIAEIAGAIVSSISDIWNDHFKPAVEALAQFFRDLTSWVKAHDKEIQAFLSSTLEVVKMVIQIISDTIVGLISGIKHILNGLIETVRAIFDIIVGVFTGDTQRIQQGLDRLIGGIAEAFWGLVEIITSPFRTAFDQVRDLWNSTIGGMGFTIPDWVPGVGGGEFRIPYMAEGGTITAAGTVLVGEQGPELLDLPSGARVRPLSADDVATSETTSYSVMVGDVNLSDDDEVRRITRAYLEQLARLASPGGLVMA